MTTVKITCRHCGSDQITHTARYLVRSLVLKVTRDEQGNFSYDDFGPDEVISDTCESVDYPFDCKACGQVDMVESDLLFDGKDHPDYDGDSETEQDVPP